MDMAIPKHSHCPLSSPPVYQIPPPWRNTKIAAVPKRQQRFASQFRPTNWCLSRCVKVSCHCETSAHTGRGNPPDRREMYRKVPEKVGVARFLAVIVTWFFSTGGLPHQCAHLLRNDSIYFTNTNLPFYDLSARIMSCSFGRAGGWSSVRTAWPRRNQRIRQATWRRSPKGPAP